MLLSDLFCLLVLTVFGGVSIYNPSHFSCLIALDRTSSTILNKSDEREHPCLVPELRGKLSDFHH